MDNIMVSNNNITYSEIQENDVYLTAKLIICDFGVNGNNVMLNRKTIDSWIDTLIDNPVVAKIGVNDDGTADFESHNHTIVNRVGENGKLYQTSKFDTSAIGTFTDVQIEKINGKEYIVATAKLWKRFPEFCALVIKRLSEGNLGTSWEITVDKSHTEIIGGQKIKIIDSGSFIGHALLNKKLPPAYKDSQVLEVASNCTDDDLIEALNKDFSLSQSLNIEDKKEVNNLEEENKIENVVDEVKSENNNVENSALTEFDLKKELRETISKKLNIEKWDFNIMTWLPVENTVWVQKWGSELDIIIFTYIVENDIVTISEPVNGKLTVSISQVNATIADLNEKLEKQNDTIIEANTQIQTLTTQVSQLEPFKLEFEKAENERVEKEISCKKEILKSKIVKSGLFSDEEIENTKEISECIDNVNESGLKTIIADRFMQTLENKKVETSETVEQKTSTKLNIIDACENLVDERMIMKEFLKKQK